MYFTSKKSPWWARMVMNRGKMNIYIYDEKKLKRVNENECTKEK